MHLSFLQWAWVFAWGVPGIPWVILKIRNYQLRRIYVDVCHIRAKKDHEALLARKLPWE